MKPSDVNWGLTAHSSFGLAACEPSGQWRDSGAHGRGREWGVALLFELDRRFAARDGDLAFDHRTFRDRDTACTDIGPDHRGSADFQLFLHDQLARDFA